MSEDTAPGRVATCGGCGSDVDTGTRYCAGCGRAVPGGDEGAAPGGGEPDEQRTTVLATADRSTGKGVVTATDRSCRSCGAGNAAVRELCVACGADLDTGDRPPTLDGASPAPPAPSSPRGRRPPWSLVVPSVVVLLGAIVGAMWVAGLGPFTAVVPVPDAAFADDRYSGDPGLLRLSDIATVTMREPDGERRFTPENMVDGDPTTAWHGATDRLPEGMDEKVDLFLARPAWVSAIVLGNGDQADSESYAASARLQRATILFDGDVAYDAVLLDLGREAQILELPEPALTTSVRIEVEEVFAGREDADVALTRIELLGWDADDDDAHLAEERADVRPAAGVISVTLGRP